MTDLTMNKLHSAKNSDEKEATFGKGLEAVLNPSSPELMTISLNDYGESDCESATDFLSPKASPMNRIPSAPMHVPPKTFNFSIPAIVEEAEHREEESPTPNKHHRIETQESGSDKKALSPDRGEKLTRLLLVDLLNNEFQHCINVQQNQMQIVKPKRMQLDINLSDEDSGPDISIGTISDEDDIDLGVLDDFEIEDFGSDMELDLL
jgi:hypothetical protein